MIDSILGKHFLNILDTFADGILILNEERNIIYCNKVLCELYGITKLELMNKNSYFPVKRGCVEHSFTELAFTTRKAITYEQTNRKGKGLVSTVSPVIDHEGNVKFVLEQVRSLASLEFYSPEAIAKALPDSDSEKKHASRRKPLLAEFKSIVMQNVYKLADSMAPKNINILILGASGTGKSELAKRIHENSARKSGPFVTINCAAIPASLIESELFGYVKGAFSGASDKGKQGLVEMANEGTLFLDEIGEIPLELQSKLLQFVQEKIYTPVGGVRPIQADTRILAATNRDIPQLINEGAFREDLYYRLATVTLILPSLKERVEDVRILLSHFCNEFGLKHETEVWFSKDTTEILCGYHWPGNIREMEHLVEFLILSCQTGYITSSMLPSNIYNSLQEAGQDRGAMAKIEIGHKTTPPKDFERVESLESYIEEQEEKLVKALYLEYHTSYKLSERLKVSQSTANRLIRKYIKSKD